MKIKSFECPKSIRNYEKKILGTSDAWSTSCLSHRPSKPAYYIVDCRILRQNQNKPIIGHHGQNDPLEIISTHCSSRIFDRGFHRLIASKLVHTY